MDTTNGLAAPIAAQLAIEGQPVGVTPAKDEHPSWVDLSGYTTGGYTPGRGRVVQILWYFTSLIVFESGWFPFNRIKTLLLRRFGARIGHGLVIKPHVRIKFPWRLAVGDHCWIGQQAWIDNLADVRLADHVCISQGVYLCTGSHNHHSRTFDLTTQAIDIRSGTWVGAAALVLGGVTVYENAIVAAGTVLLKSVNSGEIVAGNPGRVVSQRTIPNSKKNT